MLYTYYSGHGDLVRYACRGVNVVHGGQRCISFAGARPEQRITAEILRAVEGNAIEAALQAAERAANHKQARMEALSLELEQARYQARLAERPNGAFVRTVINRRQRLGLNKSCS